MTKRTRIVLAVLATTVVAVGALFLSGMISFGPFTFGGGEVSSAGAGAGTTGQAASAETTLAAAQAAGQAAAIEAKPGSLSITVEGPAVVEPFRQLSVRSGIAGTVVEAAGEGDTFTAGEILVRFDGNDYRGALRQAQLNLEQARVDLQRAELAVRRARSDLDDKESLYESGSITRTERDTAREGLASAELELTSARIKVDQNLLAEETATRNLEATEVRAPYPGVVLESGVGTGDVVSSGSVLMTFADVSRLRIRAEVDEYDVGVIEAGMAVVITADALGTEEVTSTVERVSPAAEIVNNISIFTVSAVVRADQAKLRPGMSADLTVLVSDDTGLIVPSAAVSSVRGRFYLDVLEEGQPVTRRVVAGTDDGRNIVILDGLNEGDLVILPESAALNLAIPGASGTSNGTSIIPVNLPGAGGSR
jgi:RND family efflux transporter MFP subunit